jgi:hypothetical protein
MSSHKTDRLARVLSGALRVWGVSASVEEAHSGEFIVQAPSMTLRIVPGWLVFRDGQLLASHAGLPGLLRTLRQELAPRIAGGRLIIGSQSLL